MTQPTGYRAANRRYLRFFWPLMVSYVVVVFATNFFIDEESSPLWLKTAGAIAASTPLAAVLYVMLRLVRETDEYTRLRQLTALAQGGLIVVAAAIFIGFLQIFAVIDAFPVFLLGPFFFLAYGFSFFAASRGKTV